MIASTSPTFARIRAAGGLRVGTTGDYTPFSLKRPDGGPEAGYHGADIDMAQWHPELCAVPVAPWIRLEKAYMFARDAAMKDAIDAWLAGAFGSGQWQRALDRAMSGHSGKSP